MTTSNDACHGPVDPQPLSAPYQPLRRPVRSWSPRRSTEPAGALRALQALALRLASCACSAPARAASRAGGPRPRGRRGVAAVMLGSGAGELVRDAKLLGQSAHLTALA